MISNSTFNTSLPYGVGDLDPEVVVHLDDPDKVRCYVCGCEHFVRGPQRGKRGEVCPDHGIYCHHSRYGSTYSYADVRRNIIASPEMFAERIVGHPFKYDSHRLGAENSEDALSWNVFRSLQEFKCLAQVAKLMTNEEHSEEPRLFMWGIRVDDDSFEPWDLLNAARERFERNLPVRRPLTEPDIALHLPGKYLILIEAKFTSLNPVYCRGRRKDAQSLTLSELLEIYLDASLKIINQSQASVRNQIHYQLSRNVVFSEWMAQMDSSSTSPLHINLVRRKSEATSQAEFAGLRHASHAGSFRRFEWESIGTDNLPSRQLLARYLLFKTARLLKAFAT